MIENYSKRLQKTLYEEYDITVSDVLASHLEGYQELWSGRQVRWEDKVSDEDAFRVASFLQTAFNGQMDWYDDKNPDHRFRLHEAAFNRALKTSQPIHAVIFLVSTYYEYAYLGKMRGTPLYAESLYHASLGKLDEHQKLSTKMIARRVDTALVAYYHSALFLADLGRLDEAAQVFQHIIHEQRDRKGELRFSDTNLFIAFLSLSDVLVMRGQLLEAENLARTAARKFRNFGQYHYQYHYENPTLVALHLAEHAPDGRARTSGTNPPGRLAVVMGLQGYTDQALTLFKDAETFQSLKLKSIRSLIVAENYSRERRSQKRKGYEERPDLFRSLHEADKAKGEIRTLEGHAALYYAELLVRMGKLKTAQRIASFHYRWGAWYGFVPLSAYAEVVLSDTYRLQGDYEVAIYWLQHPLSWAAEVGHQEILLKAQVALARLQFHRQQYDTALETIQNAARSAQTMDFRLLYVDSLILMARLLFIQGEDTPATEKLEEALHLAADEQCNYAWGVSSALHLLAEIKLKRLNELTSREFSATSHYIKMAIAIRRQCRDPRLQNTLHLQEILEQESKRRHGRT